MDSSTADDDKLPRTGVSLDLERLLSSRFIQSPGYGTRACSIVLFDHQNRIIFSEQTFRANVRKDALVRENIILEN